MSMLDRLKSYSSLPIDKVIGAESGGDSNAVSPKGARGLMQIMPATAREYGVDPNDLNDPNVNRALGSRILSDLHSRYGGDTRLALAAYNWGPGHVDRVGDNPNAWPGETRNYVNRISPASGSLLDRLKAKSSEPSAAPAEDASAWADDTTPQVNDSIQPYFHYDPAQAEQVEPGVTQGLQPSMIQPADLAAFGGLGMGESLAESGATALSREGLGALAKGGAQTVAGLATSGAAQDVGQPLIQAIPGDTPAGVFARGVAETAAGSVPGMLGGLGGAIERHALAKPELEEFATQAAAKSETESAAARAKLETAAEREQLAQKKSTAQAAEAAGQTRLKATADTAKSVQDAQARMAATRRDADLKAADATAALEKQTAQEVLPEAKQAAVTSAYGGLPPSPIMAQGPNRIARDQEFRETMTRPLINWRSGWGREHRELLANYMDGEPDSGPFHQGVAEELSSWPPGHAPYKPVVADLLQRAKQFGAGLTPESVEKVLRASGWTGKHFADASPEEQMQAAHTNLQENPNLAKELDIHLNPTVADFLTLQAEANRIAEGSKGADRVGAQAVSRAIDETLVGFAPTDEIKAHNAKYRDHRLNFPYKFEDHIRNAATPLEVAKDLFDYPQRVMDLADLGGDKTRRAIGQLYAQKVGQDGAKAIKPEHQPFLAKIFPGTPFADPKSWIYQDTAAGHLSQVINASPQVKAKWDAAVAEDMAKIRRQYAQSMNAMATKDAKNYGPLGEQLLTQMRQAKTPEDAATEVANFYSKLTPEAAIKAQMPTLQTPTEAAAQAQMLAPRQARQAAQAFTPEDPEAAAVRALQERGYKPTKYWQGLKQRSKYWIPGLIGGGMILGHPLSFAAGGLAEAGYAGIRELFVRSFQNSLAESPEKAVAFYRAMQRPAEPSNFRLLTSAAGRAALGSAVERAGDDSLSLFSDPGEPVVDEPQAPIPDMREKAPLPTLDAAWHKASTEHDDKQAGEIRKIVVKRLKTGEWKNLDPAMQRKLAPWLREMRLGA